VRPKKILMIDDEPDILKFTALRLETSGYEVKTAISGIDILLMLEEFDPDLILLDIKMPGLTGVEVLDMIRKSEQHAQCPVIFMTAEANLEAYGIEKIEDADGVLMKPFSSEGLLSMTHEALYKLNRPSVR